MDSRQQCWESSGFESSANFIEEQKTGVLPKTLNNMCLAAALFNPLISLLSMAILPTGTIINHTNDLLAKMGLRSAGHWLQAQGGTDATLVLSRVVLTSYAGVIGLVRRMSLDRCLPQFLLGENRWRRTNHRIILAFFTAFASVIVGLIGNVLLDPDYIKVLGIYFAIVKRVQEINQRTSHWLKERIRVINNQEIVFFAEDGNPVLLNAASLYVLQNEQNKHLCIIHCYETADKIPKHLVENVKTLDAMYPNLRVDLLRAQGIFSPDLIERLARRLNITKNDMFIGTPSDRFPHSHSDLGGVRLTL